MQVAMGIGFFQFDNLIRSRVPAYYLTTQLPFEKIFGPVELDHLQRYRFDLTQALEFCKDKPKHDAFLCVCGDGVESKKIASELVSRGYLNTFYVEGGYAALTQAK